MGDDVKMRIDVATTDKSAFESRLAFGAPELFAKGKRPYSKNRYDLSIEQYYPESGEHLHHPPTCDGEDFSYVRAGIDDDLTCAKAARRTREVLEQRRLKSGPSRHPPFIAAVIQSDELARSVHLMKAGDRYYAIEPAGYVTDVFSYDNVFEPTLNRCAKHLNRIYSKDSINVSRNDEESWKAAKRIDDKLENSEYNQHSSLASALHRKYALFLFCKRCALAENSSTWVEPLDWTEPLDAMIGKAPELFVDYLELFTNKKDPEGMVRLAAVEHDRWSAYVVTEGHELANADTTRAQWDCSKRQNYDLARLHACLVDFDSLPEVDKLVADLRRESNPDMTDEEANPNFQHLDHDILRAIKVIAAQDDETFKQEWHKLFR